MNDELLSFLNDTQFGDRLAELRNQHNISARELSLSIGQNSHYINHIENYCVYPSMKMFFYICDYLRISPKQFFDLDLKNPAKLNNLVKHASDLPAEIIDLLILISMCLNKK